MKLASSSPTKAVHTTLAHQRTPSNLDSLPSCPPDKHHRTIKVSWKEGNVRRTKRLSPTVTKDINKVLALESQHTGSKAFSMRSLIMDE